MQIMRMNENWNKISTREELIELLKGYKGILADSMINYLNSLIDLEFSVIREYISDNDRVALSELEVYIQQMKQLSLQEYNLLHMVKWYHMNCIMMIRKFLE